MAKKKAKKTKKVWDKKDKRFETKKQMMTEGEMPAKGKMMMPNMPMSYEESQRMMRQKMMAKKGMM